MNARILELIILSAAVGLVATACDDTGTSPEPETTLLSVVPEGGARDVADSTTIQVTFDHPMHDHATDYMAVHEGDVTGPEVPGSWMMEGNGMVMRFVPDTALMQGTRYTTHLGGGLEDAEGHHVDLETHGMSMGGMWADSSMMGGLMQGGHTHMGQGWQDPQNGTYGMVFAFTTGT